MQCRPLILYLAVSMLIQQAIGEFIDTFQSLGHFNTYGSGRVVQNTQHFINPPMLIMTTFTSSLTEGLTRSNEYRDFSGKAFKIRYRAAVKTMMKLRLIPIVTKVNFDNTIFAGGIEVDFVGNLDFDLDPGFVVVPMTHFAYTKSAHIGALQLIGPITHSLTIESLELIDAPLDLSVTTYTRHLVDDFAMYSVQMNSMKLEVYTQENNGENTRQECSSEECTCTPFGLFMSSVLGQISEQLAPYNECMDLTSKSIRIMYSSHVAGPRKFVLQAKRTTCSDDEIVEYTALVQLRKGINLEIILPIAITFKNVNPAVCSRLLITGPVYLHRIEIVDLDVGAAPIITGSAFQYKLFMMRDAMYGTQTTTTYRIRRSEIYDTAFSEIMALDPKRLRSKMVVVFETELGVDQGGLSKELFTLLSAEIASPARKLFHVLEDANNVLQVNPNNNNLKEYIFIGRILGMAILHNLQLTISFVPTLFKLIQEVDITIDDMKFVDPDIHLSLTSMLREKIAHLVGTTMSVEHLDSNNQPVIINLKPNGTNIPVTEANKHEFVKLYCKWRIGTLYLKQVNAIRTGIHAIIPRSLLSRFRTSELIHLINGTIQIDLDDWWMVTQYNGGYTEHHPVIQMFWACVSGLTRYQRSKVLQFVTGSPRFPPKEFRDSMLFRIIPGGDDVERLPFARSCFNTLELPLYRDQSSLCSKLLMAANESDVFDIS